jgi:acyl carrier protein
MVPSAYVSLAAFPKTPNGKVDRRALPRPEPARPRTERPPVDIPSAPRERALAAICCEVLKVDRVDPRESLFDLGADSLHVFQIVARANDAGLRVTARQILTLRTVSAICAMLDEPVSPGKPAPQLVAVSRDRYRAKVPPTS